MLAEEGHEPPAERREVGRRGRAALHEGAGAPLGADPAREHDLGGDSCRARLVQLADALPQVRELGLVEQPGGSSKTPST